MSASATATQSYNYTCNPEGFVRQGAPLASLLEESFEACKAKCNNNSQCTQFYTTFDNVDAESTRCVLLDGNQVSGKVLDMSYLPEGDTFCIKNAADVVSPIVSPSPSPQKAKYRINNKLLFFILIGVMGGTAILTLLGFILYAWMQKRKVSTAP
jgi:hypothetical protein